MIGAHSFTLYLCAPCSADDHCWVRREIVRYLEDEGYACCIHTRDFPLGRSIVDNIKLGMQCSRMVISVVSRLAF